MPPSPLHRYLGTPHLTSVTAPRMPPCPLHRALGTLTHLSRTAAPGAAPLPAMVSVSHKPSTARRAAAEAVLRLPPRAWLALTQGGAAHTTPIFSTAVAAGVMGAKQTAALIPLCHSLPLEACDVEVRSGVGRGFARGWGGVEWGGGEGLRNYAWRVQAAMGSCGQARAGYARVRAATAGAPRTVRAEWRASSSACSRPPLTPTPFTLRSTSLPTQAAAVAASMSPALPL